MKITCISDLHGYFPKLPGGDLLIVAGDLTARDTEQQHGKFLLWLQEQKYTKKVLIAGNHDGFYVDFDPCKVLLIADYLCDSGTEFQGLKIWGSPWTPPFCDWHFMLGPEERAAKWDLIPDDTDILVTHGPAEGILDICPRSFGGGKMVNVGCAHLRARFEVINPKLFVFGHIHQSYGQMVFKRPGYGTEDNTLCVNASIMNQYYEPVNAPITVDLYNNEEEMRLKEIHSPQENE